MKNQSSFARIKNLIRLESSIEDTSIANISSSSPRSNANNNSNIFPETDEIKSGKSITNFAISEALKFQKSPTKTKLFKKNSQMILHKELSSSTSSLYKKEFKEPKDEESANKQKSFQKSALNLKHWESFENNGIMDENMLIRKLKRTPKTKEDARFIYNYIKKFPFFQKFHEENLQNSVDEAIFHVCRYCEYEKHPKNTVIFREGDRSNEKFYIIISGQVHIFLLDKSVFIQENLEKNQNESVNQSHKSQARRKSSLFCSPKLTNPNLFRKKGSVMTPTIVHHFQKHSIDQENFTLKPRFFDPNLMAEIGTKRNELGPGEAFGEKALLKSNPEQAKRTATIIAATDVEFIIIKKMEFDRITQRFSKQNEWKFEFLSKVLPFLRSIRSISTLENLVYSFKEETIGLNMNVIEEKQYDPLEKVYFLSEGSCRVEKQFRFLLNGISHTTTCNICDLVEGSLIGEEIIFQDFGKNNGNSEENARTQYNYTVIVISELAKFYVINKSNFQVKFPKEIKTFLWEKFILKERSRKEIYLKNMQEQIKRHHEEQLQTLIQANFLKNKDLLKAMNTNMKRNYIDKVKGLADELTKDQFKNPSSKLSIKEYYQSQASSSDQHRQTTSHFTETDGPFSIIESLKTKAKLKEMKKTLKVNADVFQEILKNPEETEEFLKTYDHKYLIRNSAVKKIQNLFDEDFHANPSLKNSEVCDKLDFGNAYEDEKLERMQRIKLGLFKPKNPKFDHYDIIEHLTENQKHKKIERKRKLSIDESGVQMLKCLGNEVNLTERTTENRVFSSKDIRKGKTLGKFQENKTGKDMFPGLMLGKLEEKEEKEFNFYKNLKEKSKLYSKLFGKDKKKIYL